MKISISSIIAVVSVVILSACGPAKVLPIETIKPNETAFVIPLEGATGDQKKFESEKFLEDHKVASKRIEIPVRERSVGRFWTEYEWIPTVRVVVVDRSLVTREWNHVDAKAVPAKSAIAVATRESVNLHVGVNITALIQEADASKYLYWHNVKTLTEVIDTNVKGFAQGVLSREFGSRTLDAAKTEKNAIFAIVDKETKEHFKQYGITILNIGAAGGFGFDDLKMQAAINAVQTAEMDVETAKQEKLAQDQRNIKDVAKAKAAREAAEEFAKAKEAQTAMRELDIKMVQANAMLRAAENLKDFKGQLPSVLPAGAPLLFGLDRPQGK